MTWYVARASGLVAFVLLSGSVTLGLGLAARIRSGWPRFAVEELHRFLAVLTAVFVSLHGAALLLDRTVPFSLRQELVPFTSSYRPFGVALGIVAAELLAAIAVSNALRRRLGRRLWRALHYATLAIWPLAALHVLLVGTDRGELWLLAFGCLGVGAVGTAAAVRIVRAT